MGDVILPLLGLVLICVPTICFIVYMLYND